MSKKNGELINCEESFHHFGTANDCAVNIEVWDSLINSFVLLGLKNLQLK